MSASALDGITAEIGKSRAELESKEAELVRLEKLAALYPDLARFGGRWQRVVYCSELVNEQATHVFCRYNCGCCSDSPFEAWPYVKTEYGDVYSKPALFFVGEQHWISGAAPNENWEKELRKAKISETVIETLRARFESDRRERIELASTETTSGAPDPLI